MKSRRILVIDDDPTVLDICQASLAQEGYAVHLCDTGRSGLASVQREAFDLVLIDLWMHDIEGLEILREVKAIDRGTVAVMITGEPTIDSVVTAVKSGAFDYLAKPFLPDQLLIVVRRALEQKHLAEENEMLRKALKFRPGFEGIIGKSPAMQRVMDLVEKVADSDSSVVVEGETGTGKELVALSLHRNSPRRKGPFLAINCGALPEHLLESELFGHERGAFTGAHTRKHGLLEAAQTGTVFLDEIGVLSPALQVKLLRVLQERQVRRVGGHELIDIDIRVISATNENLEKAIAEGRFRNDLFYRLNVITIVLPPLRERGDDIPLLVEHFLENLNRPNRKRVTQVSAEVMELLQSYAWPGNVRELQNAVERAFLLADSETIAPSNLPPQVRRESTVSATIDTALSFSEAKRAYLEPFERGYLARILERCGGNVSLAAEQSGLHRSSFQRLLRKYEIQSDSFRNG